MEQALNVIIFWAVCLVAIIVHFECAHRLIKVNGRDDPEGSLKGAWHKAALPWITGAWLLLSFDLLFFTPERLGAFDGFIAAGLAALSFGAVMYYWGFGATIGTAVDPTYDHATDYTSNLMVTTCAMLVVFGVVCALRLCGVEIDVVKAWRFFFIL